MEEPVFVKCEPAWSSDTEEPSYFENSQLVSEMILLKQETKTELTELGSTQQNTFEPCADIKDEISIEHTNIKEDKKKENASIITMVTGEWSHSCSLCSMKFFQALKLKKHVLSHSGGRSYICALCNCTFSHKSTLKNHIRCHSGETPFHCNRCSKSFSLRSTLRSHMFTHTGEKRYCCDICSNFFSQSGSLRLHFMIHSGVKPYRCGLCHSPGGLICKDM